VEQPCLELVAQNGIIGNSGTSQAQLVEEEVEKVDSSKSSTSFLGKLVSKAGGSATSSAAGGKNNATAAESSHPSSNSPWTLSPRQVLLSSSQDLADLSLSPGELRENVVVRLDPSAAQFHAVLPSGCIVQIGNANGTAGGPVLLRLTFGCEPCGHILDRMKTLCAKKASYLTVKDMQGKRGLLATVLQGGRIKKNDALKVLVGTSPQQQAESSSSEKVIEGPLPPLIKYQRFSDTPRFRFLTILSKVPKNRVITIKQLLIYSGAPPGYARAMPAILKSIFSSSDRPLKAGGGRDRVGAGGEDADYTTVAVKEGCARLVYASRELFREDVIPSQKQTLEQAGVMVGKCSQLGVKPEKSEWCVAKKFLWQPTHAELFLVM